MATASHPPPPHVFTAQLPLPQGSQQPGGLSPRELSGGKWPRQLLSFFYFFAERGRDAQDMGIPRLGAESHLPAAVAPGRPQSFPRQEMRLPGWSGWRAVSRECGPGDVLGRRREASSPVRWGHGPQRRAPAPGPAPGTEAAAHRSWVQGRAHSPCGVPLRPRMPPLSPQQGVARGLEQGPRACPPVRHPGAVSPAALPARRGGAQGWCAGWGTAPSAGTCFCPNRDTDP